MFTIVRFIVDDCSAPEYDGLIGLFATRESAEQYAAELPTARSIVDGYSYLVAELDECDAPIETPKSDAMLGIGKSAAIPVTDVPLVDPDTVQESLDATIDFQRTRLNATIDDGDNLLIDEPVTGVPIPPPEDDASCKACGNPIDEHDPGEYDDECRYKPEGPDDALHFAVDPPAGTNAAWRIDVLERAESFIAGFEGDDMQEESVDPLLTDLRAMIADANDSLGAAVEASNALRADYDRTWLAMIWSVLEAWRSHYPEGDSTNDVIWNDVCTAMAWIAEALDVSEEGDDE